MKVAITGIPGSGKTTLAAALAAEFGLEILTAGDIGREVDPECITEGRMANPELLRAGVEGLIAQRDGWVLDGYPRSPDQVASLTPDVEVILLTVSAERARERLLRRRRVDDTPELIDKRISEQTTLLGLDQPEGWAARLASWRRMLYTDRKSAAEVARGVGAYLRGEKREVV